MDENADIQVITESTHLRLVQRGKWEFIQRSNATGVVLVVALTDDKNVLFVEQYRPPVDCRVIEFPAGLSGDDPQVADEPLVQAARRELMEETGYEAGRLRQVFAGPSSAGLTDETVTFFLADELTKAGSGGGVESEHISVHEVPLDMADDWLQSKMDEGCQVGARVYAGLYFLKQDLQGPPNEQVATQ